MTTVLPNPLSHDVPVLVPRPVGRVDWVLTRTRLYGVDSVGQTYAFAVDPEQLPDRDFWTRMMNAFRALWEPKK